MKTKLFIIFLTLNLTACTLSYRPHQGYVGYVVTPNNDNYRVDYYSDNKTFAQQSWERAALETCPSGYKVIIRKTKEIRGSIKTPVMGNMVNLGTLSYHETGLIKCDYEEPPLLQVESVTWQLKFGSHAEYYSNQHIANEIDVNTRLIKYLSTAPTSKLIDYFDWKFGSAKYSHTMTEYSSKGWLVRGYTRGSFLKSAIFIRYKGECINQITVLPYHTLIMHSINMNKNPEDHIDVTHGTYQLKRQCTK